MNMHLASWLAVRRLRDRMDRRLDEWPRVAHSVDLIAKVFVFGDTTTIRVLLAWGSIGWAVLLFFEREMLERPAFVNMRWAPSWVWGLAFMAHFVGVHWRLIDSKVRGNWAFAINALGVGLWLYTTWGLQIAIPQWTPTTSLEWCLVAAGFVALVRTGLNEEVRSA